MADGTEVATAYVSLVPSAGSLRQGIAREINGSVTGPLTAEATTAGTLAGGKLGGALATGLKAAGVAAAGAVVFDTIMKSVNAFAEAEQAQTALDVANAKSVAITNDQVAALRELNQQMQSKAAVDADGLAAADAVLARFQLTGDEIARVTPLLVDYAVASGQDTATAAETLGRALLGNARALKTMGIDYKATGDRTRDLTALMTALESKVGGMGEAFGQSTAGSLKRFELAIGDIQEAIGQAFAPAVQEAANLIEKLSPAIQNTLKPFVALGEAARPVAAAIETVATALSHVQFASQQAGIAFGNIPGLGPFLQAAAQGHEAVAAGQERMNELTQQWNELHPDQPMVLYEGALIDANIAQKTAADGGRILRDVLGALTISTDYGAASFNNLTNAIGGYAGAVLRGGMDAVDTYDFAAARADEAAAAQVLLTAKLAKERQFLDPVTKATRELGDAQTALANGPQWGPQFVRNQTEVVNAQAALERATRTAAEEQRRTAEQAAAVLAQSRQSIAEAINGSFVNDLVSASREQIGSALTSLLQQVRQFPQGIPDYLSDLFATSNQRLQALATQRTGILDQIQAAQADLVDSERQRAALAQRLQSQSVGSFVDLGNQMLQKPDDVVTNTRGEVIQRSSNRGAAIANLTAATRLRIETVKEFTRNLKALQAKGLPKELLQQLIDAGPDAAGALAKELVNTSDWQYQQLVESAQQLQTVSANLGTTAGSIMFDAGIQAAQGIVDGLKSQREAIAKEMSAIGDLLVESIRKSLGIRSPSTVMAKVGEQIGAGLIAGMASTRGAVAAATSSLISIPDVPKVSVVAPTTSTTAPGTTGTGAAPLVGELNIYNPTPEPASTSVAQQLRRQAFVLGGAS